MNSPRIALVAGSPASPGAQDCAAVFSGAREVWERAGLSVQSFCVGREGDLERWAEIGWTGVRLIDWEKDCGPSAHPERSAALAAYRALARECANNPLRWIFFNDLGGLGYYAFQAKKLGLAFQETGCGVAQTGSGGLRRSAHGLPIQRATDLGVEHMEREALAMAERVIGPGPNGFERPPAEGDARTTDWRATRPVPSGIARRESPVPEPPKPSPEGWRRLVYLGPLEYSAPLRAFGKAATECVRAGWLPHGLETMLIGETQAADFKHLEKFFLKGSAGTLWTREWRPVRSWAEAGALLGQPGDLVIIPEDCGLEIFRATLCCLVGAPFLGPASPGLEWLLDPACHDSVLASAATGIRAQRGAAMPREAASGAPERPPLAQRIREVWSLGALAPAAFREDAAAAARVWEGAAAPRRAVAPKAAALGGEAPLVTVCLTCFNRHQFLPRALEAIEAQTYRNLEVILADDGSTAPKMRALLEDLEPRLARRGWRLLRLPHQFCAKARNAAAAAARGEYLVFMDDDNIAEPQCVETLVRAAQNGNVDLVTCGRWLFDGEGDPRSPEARRRAWVPLGPVPWLALFFNGLGDMTFLVHRTVFLDLGGFSEEYGVLASDRDFLLRACASGKRLEVAPELLYYYRVSPSGLTSGRTLEAAVRRDVRLSRTVQSFLPEPLRGLAGAAGAIHQGLESARARIAALERRVARLESERAALAKLARASGRPGLVRRLVRSIRKRWPFPRANP